MRTVTHEEIQASMNCVHAMTESETRKLMHRMLKEQPYLQVYMAAICEQNEFDDENDADAFANLSGIIWHVMRRAAGGPLMKVKGHDIDNREEQIMQLYRYAEGEAESDWPSMVQEWIGSHNQRPLLEYVLHALMSPENPYDVTEKGSGMIFAYLKVIIDCLDNAKPKLRI